MAHPSMAYVNLLGFPNLRFLKFYPPVIDFMPLTFFLSFIIHTLIKCLTYEDGEYDGFIHHSQSRWMYFILDLGAKIALIMPKYTEGQIGKTQQ